ncbi:MAG: SRPBCC family protein, partial [Ignavibacteriota bacterium]
MKTLKIILYIVLGLVLLVLGLAFIAPTKLHVERNVVIKAPRAVIFRNVKLFSNIKKWSPWEEKDPNMKSSIEGNDGTVGARYKWIGNDDVGEGEQTFQKIEENSRVETDLHFIKPWESHAAAYTILSDSGDGVKVSWGFNTEMARPFNIMGLFMNMDRAVGDDFSRGLGKLKVLSENDAKGFAGGYKIIETTTGPRTFIGIRKTLGFDKLMAFFSENYPKLFADLKKANILSGGAPAGLFYSSDQ